MVADTFLIFEEHMDVLPLYEKLEERILDEIDSVQIKVQKSQMTDIQNEEMFL